jgi:hypothetical protein
MFEGTDSLSYKSFKTYLCKIPTVTTETYINQHAFRKIISLKTQRSWVGCVFVRSALCEIRARDAWIFLFKTRVHFMSGNLFIQTQFLDISGRLNRSNETRKRNRER